MLKFLKSHKHFVAVAMIAVLLSVSAYAFTPGKDMSHMHDKDMCTKHHDMITKAEFIAKISDYFDWPHPSEYNDVWKAPLKQFNDVKTTDRYGKQIECAYEENIIAPDAAGNFNPKSEISRQDAAIVFVKAFKIQEWVQEMDFLDAAFIRPDALGSVNALVSLGYMSGRTPQLFMPNAPITESEVDSIFNMITTTMASPVQALPKQTVEPYYAPRRFIKLYNPTPGVKIYYTKGSSSTGWPIVADPTTASPEYILAVTGQVQELVGSRSGASDTDPTDVYLIYKAIAVKDGLITSPVQTFKWHMYRPHPTPTPFGYIKIMDKTAKSPAVYELYNNSDTVRPMAWYIEGQNSGIIYDALQTSISTGQNLKTFIDNNIATKPYICVIGHTNGDHFAQLPNFLNAGIDVYVNKRGFNEIRSMVSTVENQAKIKNIDEGDSFDLGGCTLNVYALPGHSNSNIILQDKMNGLVFASDIYGCTRAGSADNVAVAGLRADLLLSFAQQTYSNYKKHGGKTTSLFTGHDESPLADINFKLFAAALQQVIDKGEAGCMPTLRGNTDAPGSRTTMIGDMWKDATRWISLKLAGKMGDSTEYLTSASLPYMALDPINSTINYNGPDGYLKYSVLSNIEIEGGELIGKEVAWQLPSTITWAGNTIVVNNSLPNKLNPWDYNYTINVPWWNRHIMIKPTTMSTKVKSITLNGREVDYRSWNKIHVYDGMVITIKIVAPDNVTTSTYTFTVDMI